MEASTSSSSGTFDAAFAHFCLSRAFSLVSSALSDAMKNEAFPAGNCIGFLCWLLLLGRCLSGSAQAQNSDLSLSLSNAPVVASVGQYFRFTVYIFNNGPDTATNVVISDTVPGNATWV